eukprot:229507-Chlamydomonas_euryale.AAC.7
MGRRHGTGRHGTELHALLPRLDVVSPQPPQRRGNAPALAPPAPAHAPRRRREPCRRAVEVSSAVASVVAQKGTAPPPAERFLRPPPAFLSDPCAAGTAAPACPHHW